MAWQSEMVRMLRHIINDLDETSYTDDRLRELILVSSQIIQGEIDFSQTYTIDVDAFTLTPDPTENTKDIAFISLVVLKSACILLNAEAKTAAGQAIAIRDGSSSISLAGAYQGKKEVAKTICEQYRQALWDYKAGSSPAGRIIVGPYNFESNEQANLL